MKDRSTKSDFEVPSRGRLKLFLGVGPGQDHTIEMLRQARRLRRSGRRVIPVGFRSDGQNSTVARILAQLQEEDGFNPRSVPSPSSISGLENATVLLDGATGDIDARSGTESRAALIDQYRQEGIDVYSTLGIHELESLADIVETILEVPAPPSVPDSFFDSSDEVELVDVPGVEMFEYLAPESGGDSIWKNLDPGRLAALRQLALRRTANRVEEQMRQYQRHRKQQNVWPVSERVLTVVTPDTVAEQLIRKTRITAERRGAGWLVVFLESKPLNTLPEWQQEQIATLFQLAERLGGETVVLPVFDPVVDLLEFARRQGVTEILLGRAAGRRFSASRYGQIRFEYLLRESGPIDIRLVTEEEQPAAHFRRSRRRPRKISLARILWTVAVITGAFAIALLLQTAFSVAILPIYFIPAVLIIALRSGLWSSLAASICFAIAFPFLFREPLWSLAGVAGGFVPALIVFLLVSAFVSSLTSTARGQAKTARRREQRTAALYRLSSKLTSTTGMQSVANVIVKTIFELYEAPVVLIRDRGKGLEVISAAPAETRLTRDEEMAINWTWENGQPSGFGTERLLYLSWLFLPLKSSSRDLGVLGIRLRETEPLLSYDQRQIIESLVNIAAGALEREALQESAEEAELLRRHEELYGALLSSITHDFRTPLASISGAAETLLLPNAVFSDEAKNDMLMVIREEAERLNRFVANLLDMTKLESGLIKLNADWTDLGDLIGTALSRKLTIFKDREIDVQIAPKTPLVKIDFVLMEHVLLNLLDNAAKYSPATRPIIVRAEPVRRGDDRQVRFEVIDSGRGIPEPDLERIFDKFYRISQADVRSAGTGLGLSIARGIVEAHGGTIEAVSPVANGEGTSIVIHLPVDSSDVDELAQEESPPVHSIGGEDH